MSMNPPRRSRLERLRPIHRRMSFVAFERLPRQIGWKYEYYTGRAHITPSKINVTLLLDLVARPTTLSHEIRSVSPADRQLLHVPFLEAFALAPEYVGYPLRLFRKRAREYLQGFFGEVRGERSNASVLAEDQG